MCMKPYFSFPFKGLHTNEHPASKKSLCSGGRERISVKWILNYSSTREKSESRIKSRKFFASEFLMNRNAVELKFHSLLCVELLSWRLTMSKGVAGDFRSISRERNWNIRVISDLCHYNFAWYLFDSWLLVVGNYRIFFFMLLFDNWQFQFRVGNFFVAIIASITEWRKNTFQV